jgi:hypothetical protein
VSLGKFLGFEKGRQDRFCLSRRMGMIIGTHLSQHFPLPGNAGLTLTHVALSHSKRAFRRGCFAVSHGSPSASTEFFAS